MPRSRPLTLPLVSIILVSGILLGFLWLDQPAQAASTKPQTSTEPGVSNDTCLGCHGVPGQIFTMPNGDILDLTINAEEYNNSAHGDLGYACIQCHTDIREYPHPERNLQSAREVTLQYNATCNLCHEWVFEKQANSVHARAMNEGQDTAAICVDCHGAHNIQRWNDPQTGEKLPAARLRIPQTCAKCHSAIYEKYRLSVHGAALTDEQNLDVPTCVDCHGVHDIQDPGTAEFRLQSPSMCAKCHTDEEKMARYGLSTYVMSSYVADFHGTTVTLFEEQSPDAETNKAVCYDCHGIHDIQRTKDPNTGLQLQDNLLVRCQECHPDATANFPAAWLSHYQPSPDKYPIVYYVNLFYTFFIPGTLGGMGFLVALDVGRRLYDRSKTIKFLAPREQPSTETQAGETIPEALPIPPEKTDQPAEPPLDDSGIQETTAEVASVPGVIEPAEESPQISSEPEEQSEEEPQINSAPEGDDTLEAEDE